MKADTTLAAVEKDEAVAEFEQIVAYARWLELDEDDYCECAPRKVKHYRAALAALTHQPDRAAVEELREIKASMKYRTSLIGRTTAERDALREALDAEDAYWAASRALAAALPRLREPAQTAFAAAEKRRDASRQALANLERTNTKVESDNDGVERRD